MIDKKLTRAINELKRSDQVIQSLCPKGYIHPVLGSIHAAIADFQEALAQPEQEPVAWGVFEGNLHDMFFSQAEAEHMALLKGSHAEVRPLYTTPPQRTWVGLTDDEYFALQMKIKTPMTTVQDYIDAMRMIEQALKEKNT
jgi:uncharacterized protein YukE